MAIRKASGSTAINRGVNAAVSTVANPTAGVNPIIINNVYITDSSYNVLDDTAVSSSGGYLKIIGTGFEPGCVAYIGGTAASSTTFVSGTEIRVATPVLSSNTYLIYVLNPDNTIGIKLNALVVSGTPSWSTSATLLNQLVDVAISVQLSASSDSTITYSLAAGSSLPSGTTLYSNGLFTGTVTGLTTDTVYSFGVVATDVELQDVSRTFTVTVGLGDTYFNTSTLLINGESKSWITDSGATKRVLTLGGNVTPSPFSPYNTNWSAYLNGSSDYISVANTTPAAFGTGPYTIEFWYWGDGSPLVYQPVFNGSAGLSIYVGYNSGSSIWYAGNPLIRDGTLIKNGWNFLQFIRTSTAAGGLTMNMNGVTYTGTDSNNWGAQTFTVGFDPTPRYVTGYLADLRISNTARPVATPTTRFTADANTTFLTFQDGYARDKSSAASPIVKNGSLTYRSFGPYTETDLTTGSILFDGTGDYVTVPDSASLELGSGDFCAEMWFYTTSVSTTRVLLSKNSGSYGPLLIWQSAANLQVYMSNNGSAWNILAPAVIQGTIQTNNWNHIAVYKVGSVIYTAFNGTVTVANNNSLTTPIDNSVNWTFGTQPDGTTNPYIGYISDARITIGSSPYTSSNFTPPTAPLAATSNTQLLTFQYREGETNHRFLDEGGIKLPITRNGNVSQGSFTPYSPSGWSAYFDGSGDYLACTNSTTFGTGDFTVECWVHTPSPFNTYSSGIIGTTNYNGVDRGWALDVVGSNGYLRFYLYNSSGTGVTLNTTTVLPANQWVHLAAVRSGTTVTIYMNGVSIGSGTNGTNDNFSAPIYFGTIATSFALGVSGYSYTGYISNARVVAGVAVYTGNFTPPTNSLASTQSAGTNIAAITGTSTSLLTLQDNRFKDNSSSASTITKSGDARIVPFSPFRPSAVYDPAVHGGSAYFDGSGDYLSFNSSAAEMTIGTVDFIIECWVYGGASASAWWCLDCRPGADGVYPLLYWDGTSFVFYVSTAARITSTATNIYGQWAHVVVSRVSGSTRMFVNGVVQSTVYSDTNSYLSPGSSRPYVGLNGLNGLNPSTGYISGLRVVKNQGVTSVTVPTSPPAITGNTMLYASFTNAGVVDATCRNVIETAGAATLSNIQTKWNNGSISFPGALSGYMATPTKPELNFGTGDFTVECWVYFNSVAADQGLFGGSTTNAWEIRWRTSTGLNLGRLNTAFDSIFAWTPTVSTWYHLAVTRSGTSVRAFINGTQIGSTSTNSNTYNSGTLFYLGITDTSNNPLNGYLDDVRITKGYARYTSNFTAPAQAFFTK
jgi:hypothetical protein